MELQPQFSHVMWPACWPCACSGSLSFDLCIFCIFVCTCLQQIMFSLYFSLSLSGGELNESTWTADPRGLPTATRWRQFSISTASWCNSQFTEYDLIILKLYRDILLTSIDRANSVIFIQMFVGYPVPSVVYSSD